MTRWPADASTYSRMRAAGRDHGELNRRSMCPFTCEPRPTIRRPREIFLNLVRRVRQAHRIARKGDGDRCPEHDVRRVLGRQCEREKRIVHRLRGPEAIEAGLFRQDRGPGQRRGLIRSRCRSSPACPCSRSHRTGGRAFDGRSVGRKLEGNPDLHVRSGGRVAHRDQQAPALYLLVVEHRIGMDTGGGRHVPMKQHRARRINRQGSDNRRDRRHRQIGEVKRITQCDTLISVTAHTTIQPSTAW